jgi:hypothetical protein
VSGQRAGGWLVLRPRADDVVRWVRGRAASEAGHGGWHRRQGPVALACGVRV